MKITTVITTYSNKMQRYLDWLFWSLERQQGVDNELILVTHDGFIPKLPPDVKVIIRPKEETSAQYVNAGFMHARPDSKIFFTCNDDVFLCKNSLAIIAHWAADTNSIVNPYSNTDARFSYWAKYEFGNVELPQFMRLEQIEPHLEKLYNHFDLSQEKIISMFPTRWLCMFATAIPADIWRKLEGYDTVSLGKFGAADADFCLRARRDLDVRSAFCTNAFMLHYGGVTSSDLDSGIRTADRQLFIDKWGHLPEHLAT